MSEQIVQQAQSINTIDTLAVVGVGLIGGSFAAALRQAGAVKRIVAAGRRSETLEQALDLGLIDEIVSYETLAAQADVIFLGTPVGAMADVLTRLLPHLKPDAILTDGGSRAPVNLCQAIPWQVLTRQGPLPRAPICM